MKMNVLRLVPVLMKNCVYTVKEKRNGIISN